MLQKLQNKTDVNDEGVDHSSVNFKPYTLSLEESRKYCENIVVIVPELLSSPFLRKRKITHTKKKKKFPTETVQRDTSISPYFKSPL